jgi:hypothetical protein
MAQDSFQEGPIDKSRSESSLKTIYRPEDIKGVDYDKDLGDGGGIPFYQRSACPGIPQLFLGSKKCLRF